MSADPEPGPHWSDDDTRDFLDLGDLFVPRREEQMQVVVDLLPHPEGELRVLELCCGAGLLASRILESRPDASVLAIDGSAAMVGAARRANEGFGGRFRAEVAELDGYRPPGPFDAVVSSLALHHLDDDGKQTLFADAARALSPGGALLIADLVEPRSAAARRLAAGAWDAAVVSAAARIGRPDAIERFRDEGWNHYALVRPDPLDRPSPIAAQLAWLRAAGFEPDVFWLYAGHAVYGGYLR